MKPHPKRITFQCTLDPIDTEGHRGDNFKVTYTSSKSKTTLFKQEDHIFERLEERPGRNYFGKTITKSSQDSEESIQRLLNEIYKRQTPSQEDPYRFLVPKTYGIWNYTSKSSEECSISIYEFVRGKSLPAGYLKMASSHSLNSKTFEQKFFGFSSALCRAVQLIHNHGLVHSVIAPRNIRVEHSRSAAKSDLTLVGFGYSALSDGIRRSRITTPHVITDSDALFRAPECKNADTHSAYWLPADIYSIGAILYWLCIHSFDNAIPNKEREWTYLLKNHPLDVGVLKESLADHLRRFASPLYLANENICKILDTCLRYKPEDRFSCIEELQEALEIAQRTASPKKLNTKPRKPVIDASIEKSAKRAIREVNLFTHGYFQEHLEAEVGKLAQLAKRCTRGGYSHFEVYGSRDRIVNSLCRMLASLGLNHTYFTVTLPDYWSDHNLGSNGRFLTMNKHMARNRLRIQRVFLVTKEKFYDLPSEEQRILEWQLRAKQELAEENPEHADNFDVRVLPVSLPEVAEFEAAGSTVAFMGPHNIQSMLKDSNVDLTPIVCLNFFSTAVTRWAYNQPIVSRTITKLRFWSPARDRERFLQNINKASAKWDEAKPLESYLCGGLVNPIVDTEGYNGPGLQKGLEQLLQE